MNLDVLPEDDLQWSVTIRVELELTLGWHSLKSLTLLPSSGFCAYTPPPLVTLNDASATEQQGPAVPHFPGQRNVRQEAVSAWNPSLPWAVALYLNEWNGAFTMQPMNRALAPRGSNNIIHTVPLSCSPATCLSATGISSRTCWPLMTCLTKHLVWFFFFKSLLSIICIFLIQLTSK